MHITIIGAGLGGLSTALSLSLAGHRVTILESSPTLAALGAGVQLTPNATRLFWKWGLESAILSHAVLPASFNIRRDSDDTLLRKVALDGFKERYGGPYLVIHRADITRILFERAEEIGVRVRFGCTVTEYEFDAGAVRLDSSEVVRADLVVASDGIKSLARDQLLAHLGKAEEEEENKWAQKTGWAAYRLTAPVAKLRENPLTQSLAADSNCNCWIGESRSVMTYLMRGAQILNIVLSHPDDVDTSRWTPAQYRHAIALLFGDVSPSLQALLALANPEVQNWPVYQIRRLPAWTAGAGRFVLMGDAAHAMAFYLSMGVSMAIEDADTLTGCLALMEREGKSLLHAMAAFDRVRRGRAEAVKDASLHAGRMLHLGEGELREVRDEAMGRDGVEKRDDVSSIKPAEDAKEEFWKSKVAYGIADQEIRDWCYGYDVQGEVAKAW
ncbi:uncharacterized protein L3040_006825 [Drepanopeziza brunnea f. sp. 'multigermtubi']|nr:hypothetical protein L3040_006825 [Drepanopeziza brunnea f. sp. 'multigermtubi']